MNIFFHSAPVFIHFKLQSVAQVITQSIYLLFSNKKLFTIFTLFLFISLHFFDVSLWFCNSLQIQILSFT